MSHVLNDAKRAVAEAEIDLATADWRVLLVMLNSTVPSENDGIINLDDYSILDEFDGAGYSRKTLTGVTLTKVDASDNVQLVANNPVWTSQAAGTRNIAGALLYIYVDGTAANDIPFAFFTGAGAPVGDDVTIRWSGEASSGIVLTLE